MADLTHYEQLVSNPNVRTMLDIIAKAEGTAGHGDNGYNVTFGYGQFSDYSAHPNIRKGFRNTNGKRQKTSAAGRYQIIKPTYNGHAKKLGVSDFSPKTQDLLAVSIIEDTGALDDVLAGDYKTAIEKLGTQWASLPSSPYPQPKKSWADVLPETGGSGSQARQLPVVPVTRGGVQMLAVPDSAGEQSLMEQWGSVYPTGTQEALVNALGMLNAARESSNSDALFEPLLPTDLDNDLLELIRSL